MAKKIIRYFTLLTPIILSISVVLNVWCVKDTVTDKGFTSQGWGLFNTPSGVIDLCGFENAWLIVYGVFVVISLAISIVLFALIVSNSFKITNLHRFEKYLAIALSIATALGVIFGIVAILTNASLGFMAGNFIKTSKLVPRAGLYLYVIGGIVFSVLSILGNVLKDTTK